MASAGQGSGGKDGGSRRADGIGDKSGGPTRVALLGSGGSIGRQAVDVLLRHPDTFRVVALATGSQAQILEEQARQLRPAVVSLADERAAARLELPAGTEFVGGLDALEGVVTRPDVAVGVVVTGGLGGR